MSLMTCKEATTEICLTNCKPTMMPFSRSRTPQPPAEDEEENIDDSLVTIDTCKCKGYIYQMLAVAYATLLFHESAEKRLDEG